MKQTILFLILLISTTSYSQEFKGGILAGFITSQVDGDSWSGYNKSSFSAGVFVNRQLSEKMAGQIEFRYIRKGAIHDDTKDGGTNYYRSRLNYIEVPILAQYTKGNFIFEAGPALGVLINSSEEDLYGEISTLNGFSEFNRIEISAVGGFAYQVIENVRINFRFEYSMLPIRKNFSDNIVTEFYNQQYSFNNSLSFSVYYFI